MENEEKKVNEQTEEVKAEEVKTEKAVEPAEKKITVTLNIRYISLKRAFYQLYLLLYFRFLVGLLMERHLPQDVYLCGSREFSCL